MTVRRVVLLCGPPGAGKSTVARAGGLDVYDRDDPQWPGERQFRAALIELGRDPDAQAVVIRSGASGRARAKAAALVQATHVYLLLLDPAQLGHRVAHRGQADMRRGLASIRTWYTGHDRDDGVEDWPGWDRLPERNWYPDPQPQPRERLSTVERGLGAAHKQGRAALLCSMQDGAPCPLSQFCGGLPMFHPKRCPFPGDGKPDGLCFACRLDRDHSVPRALGGTRSAGRLAHARCNRQAGAAMTHRGKSSLPEW